MSDHVYLVVKHSYGDFDIAQSDAVAASLSEPKANEYAEKQNQKVDPETETSFKVQKLKLI